MDFSRVSHYDSLKYFTYINYNAMISVANMQSIELKFPTGTILIKNGLGLPYAGRKAITCIPYCCAIP